jgi:two-component system cell cycle response regulator CtrA
MRVLVIEDDADVAKLVRLALENERFVCDVEGNGDDGISTLPLFKYDIVILDLGLPDMDGLEVLRLIRKDDVKIPVLILSGLDDSERKVKGLSLGADDYLTKPFNSEELVARIKAIVRRHQGHSEAIVNIGKLKVNMELRITTYNDEPIHLTPKEQTLLESLALKKDHAVSKEILLDKLYGLNEEPEGKIIDVFICKIRKKIQNASGGKDYIKTVWGRGYTLAEPVEEKQGELL